MENEQKQEIILSFARKGFLLDKETLEFFVQLSKPILAEHILNKVSLKTHSRMISKKHMIENYNLIKEDFKDCDLDIVIINNFFKDAMNSSGIKIDLVKNRPSINYAASNLKVISSNVIPYRRIEVKDFVTHFKNRYNFFKNLLMERKELANLVSINKIGNNRSFSIIGLVSSKRITKNKNLIIEVEDLTGKISVLIAGEKEELLKKSKEIVLDDVIGIKCSGNGKFVYANDVFFVDSFIAEKKKSEEEAYAVFISDIHIGSKLFLEENFKRFISWINGQDMDEIMANKVSKIRYLFVVGDNVDGVGVYPGQEALLNIKDLKEQYKKLAEYFKMIPAHIKIIMCPGQHDAVRVPEPQPAVGEDFAKELCEMSNVYLVSNPAMVEIEAGEKKHGIKVLMYHGASMIRNWMDEVEELRIGKAHLNPSKIVKFMLRHRHLSPSHSSNVYVPSEKEDMLIINPIPDIVTTGDLHKSDVDSYNNTLIISCSCWQSTTPFEEKVGNQPDPCKVPFLNLKTRELKILDFT